LSETASYVLPVDKPAGPTSHDVVARARRALGTRRIGHTGTLDPFASGLLLLCVGNATRIAEYLTDLPKRYRARARLDGRTMTDDNTSEIIEPTSAWRELTERQIRAALQAQVGAIEQMPPQFSAKKIAGERAYDIARRGDVATLTPVQVTIYNIEVYNVQLPEVAFDVECSSGTYIRAIARDLGETLGTGGYLTELRRTSVGRHDIAHAVPLDALDDAERVQRAALTPLQALAHMETVTITADESRAIRFGQRIPRAGQPAEIVQLIHDGHLVAIARAEGDRWKPHKVFADV
jgi:tRNA pseudouridine55 synthase